MHYHQLQRWQHEHTFGQDQRRPGEARTLVVIGLTSVMMVVEITAGIVFGSMALLADGLHMASHAAALAITAIAYVYARRHAHDSRFCFGTGKVNSLGGFTGAVLLAVFALMMAWESIERLITPVAIAFNQAILVAVIGLVVNAVSVFILGHEHDHDHEDGHHQHDDHHEHHHLHGHHGNGLEHDHNLRAAYFHVLADALTSLLAIFALLAGKYFHLVWMDPVMGLVGAALVTRWSIGLLRTTSAVLLDRNGPAEIRERVIQSLESHDDNRVADLHLWQIAPGAYALIVSVVTHEPKAPDYYKSLLPGDLGLKHVTVEVHQCHDDPQWPCNDKATAEFAASNR